jgi:FkbM family methyltransferase
VHLARERDITVVVEVGSNKGGFVRQLRSGGYQGRIVSFEPLSQAFAQLEAASASDPAWECIQLALGSRAGTATINVSGNSVSSSLLGMKRRHEEAAPGSGFVGTESCAVATLDSLRDEVLQADDRVYLKLDVQGFELEVLHGAAATLEQVAAVDVELSLVPLYDGSPGVDDVLRYLDERHFGVVALDPGFVEKDTGCIMQVNGLFARLGDAGLQPSAAAS